MEFEQIYKLSNIILDADLEKIDTIKVDKKQLVKLFDWKDNNKELVRNFKYIFNEVTIDFTEVINGDIYTISKTYCKALDDDILNIVYNLNYIENNKLQSKPIISFKYDLSTREVFDCLLTSSQNETIFKYIDTLELKTNNKNLITIIQDLLTQYAIINAYMNNHKKQIVINEVKKELTKKDKQMLERKVYVNKNTNTDNIIKIKNVKTVYTFPEPKKIITRTLTKREIKQDAWNVRGHYRTLQSGKSIFVKPYVKGKNKDKIKSKIYKFEIE